MADILVIAFSDLARDARVHRQLTWLTEAGHRVVAAAHAPAEGGGVEFVELAREPARSTAQGAMVHLRRVGRRWESAYWADPRFGRWRDILASQRADLVITNDLLGLPLAFAVAGDTPVLFDAHEYAPEEFADSRAWRALVAPQLRAIADHYMRRAIAVTTVSQGIAELYERDTGIRAHVVTNASAFRELEPQPVVQDRFKLVHWGVADPQRRLELMVAAVRQLDQRFSLDLFLLGE